MITAELDKQRLKKQGQLSAAWSRLRKRPSAMIAIAGILVIVLIAVFADVLVDWDSRVVSQDMANKFLAPGAEYLFGTDHLGRDILGRIIHGTRTALLMGVIGSMASIVVATALACCCAYFGGIADMIIMRIVDVLSAIPPTVIALAICAGLGNGLVQLIFALAMGSIAVHTRMIRSYALTVAKSDFIEASAALGASTGRIMIQHIIPNIISIIIIQFSGNISINILMGATLSFIGLGVKAPRPEWGLMLSEGMKYMTRAPHMIIFPALALVITAVCINTFGDALRDALDPQLKGKA